MLTDLLHALNAAWDRFQQSGSSLPTHVKVACYVLVPLVVGLGAELLFESLRRRRARRAAESERAS